MRAKGSATVKPTVRTTALARGTALVRRTALVRMKLVRCR